MCQYHLIVSHGEEALALGVGDTECRRQALQSVVAQEQLVRQRSVLVPRVDRQVPCRLYGHGLSVSRANRGGT